MDLATLLQSLLNQQMPAAPARGEMPMSGPNAADRPGYLPAKPVYTMAGRQDMNAPQSMPAQMSQQVAPRAPQQPAQPQSSIGSAIGDFVGELFNPGQRARNKTVEWLQQNGLDEGSATLVAGNRDLLNRFMVSRMSGGDPTKALEAQKLQLEIDNMRNPRVSESDRLAREKFDRDNRGYRPITSPDERARYGIQPNDTRAYQIGPDDKLEVVGGSGQTINVGSEVDARKAAADQMGLSPDDPRYQPFVLTGKFPREDAQALTATDKKAILEADEMVSAAQGALPILSEALKLNDKAYEGPLAGARGYATSIFGSDAGEATLEYDNLVQQQALSQLKAIFGAAPTEGERKILLDIAGSSSLPANVRKGVLERAQQAVQRRLAMYKGRADELRGGTFYKPEGGATPSVGGGDPLGIR